MNCDFNVLSIKVKFLTCLGSKTDTIVFSDYAEKNSKLCKVRPCQASYSERWQSWCRKRNFSSSDTEFMPLDLDQIDLIYLIRSIESILEIIILSHAKGKCHSRGRICQT